MRQLLPQYPDAPSWVYSGAKYDLKFDDRKFYGIDCWLGSYASLSPRTWNSAGAHADGSVTSDTVLNLWRDGLYRPSGTSAQATVVRMTDYGLWAEGPNSAAAARRNYVLQCRDLSNASWTKTNATAAKDQVGITGVSSSASSLTATATNGTATQTLSFTGKLVTYSVFLKRITGVGTVNISGDTGGAGYTDVTSQINSSTWTRIRLTSATLTNPTIGIQLGTSGDKIAVDVVQEEPGDQTTSPLINTTAVNFEGPAMFSFNTAGGSLVNDGKRILTDIDIGQFAVMVQYSGNFSTSAGHGLLISDGGFTLQGSIGASSVNGQVNSQTIGTANSDMSGLFTLNKVIFRCDGSGGAICLNGGAIAKSSAVVPRSTASGLTHMGIGSNGSNTVPMNGYIKRVTVWKNQLPTDGQMIDWSTVLPSET